MIYHQGRHFLFRTCGFEKRLSSEECFRTNRHRRLAVTRFSTSSRLYHHHQQQQQQQQRQKEQHQAYWCENVIFDKSEQPKPGCIVVTKDQGIIERCLHDVTLEQTRQEYSNVIAFDTEKDCVLAPGLIDVHTHISALGREWEGYETATKAAAAGGITTIVGMPLNSNPPTTTIDAFQQEIQAANDAPLYVNVGLWGGVIPENCHPDKLRGLLDAGVFGLKAFLSPLPPAAGYQAVSPDELKFAASICGPTNKPILVHSELMTSLELQEAVNTAYLRTDNEDYDDQKPRDIEKRYQAHVQSRPAKWEQDAVRVVCQLAETLCRMHIVHLSDAHCLDIIQEAKQRIQQQQTTNNAENSPRGLTVETCPHYLLFDSDTIPDGDTRYKCFPPIRDLGNRERLWNDGLVGRQSLIDMIASDHSPCEPDMRCMDTGNLFKAWGGLSGLQYQLHTTWTEAHRRGSTVTDIVRWWSEHPSRLANLEHRKGSLAPGKDADFIVWDPSFVGPPNSYSQEYHYWQGTTVFADMELRGRVLGTWVGGVHVYDGQDDKILDPAGTVLTAD